MMNQADGMKIEFVRGTEAKQLLDDVAFGAEWSALWHQCPWVTPFQLPGYACTWYAVYRETFEPLLILSRDERGRLQGLLTLAVAISSGRVVVAGDFQAEYQTWICPPELAETFPPLALRELWRHLPAAILRLNYLPPCTPTAWLEGPEAKQHFLLKSHRRPLIRFGDGREIAESLAKRSNKNRLRQIEKLGDIEHRHVTDPAEMEAVIDAIIPFHDARHLAVRGLEPFVTDPLRRTFALRLMKVPGLLHVTTFKAGEHLITAALCGIGKKEVQLGLIAHNPWLSRYSPGKFQIFFLSRMLMEQGFEQLDLTPGGDPYKERFANTWDEVHTLTLFPNWVGRAKGVAFQGIEGTVRGALRVLRVSPDQARLFALKIKAFRPIRFAGRLIRRASSWIGSQCETRIYSYPAASVARLDAVGSIRRDALADLLLYEPERGGPSRRDFIASAMQRIEDNQHAYTRAESGRLRQYAWLAERPSEELASQTLPGYTLPPDSALIAVLHTIPQRRSREFGALSLAAMLRDAARVPKTRSIFIPILADDAASRRLIAETGFVYEGSLFQQTRFGRCRQWTIISESRKFPASPPPADTTRPKELAGSAS